MSLADQFFKAAVNGNLKSVRDFIENKKVDVNIKDKYGDTALHYAAIKGLLDIVKYLIENTNIDVYSIDKDGYTVLYWAVDRGHLDIVKYLIENINIDVNSKDKDGNTALHEAAYNDHLDIVKYLIENTNIDVNSKSKDGNTALDIASRNGYTNIVKYLQDNSEKNNLLEIIAKQKQQLEQQQTTITQILNSNTKIPPPPYLPIDPKTDKIIERDISKENATIQVDETLHEEDALSNEFLTKIAVRQEKLCTILQVIASPDPISTTVIKTITCPRCKKPISENIYKSHSKTHSTEVLPFLFLGSEINAKNKIELQVRTKITHILNVAWECPNYWPNDFIYKNFKLADVTTENIGKVFHDAIDFIEHVRNTGGIVLVHCIQGMSRSVSIVLAYLMSSKKWNFNEAFTYLKELRPFIDPNPGFIQELEEYSNNLQSSYKSENEYDSKISS